MVEGNRGPGVRTNDLARVDVEDVDEEIFELYVKLQSLGSKTHLKRNMYQYPSKDEVNFSVGGQSVVLKQHRDINNEEGMTGGWLWDAALVLTYYLDKFGKTSALTFNEKTTVLELGAGCGLCGLVCDKLLEAGETVLTDQEQVLNLLRANSLKRLKYYGEEVKKKHWDYVLAADCVFSETYLTQLVQTLRESHTPGKTRTFICSELRDHTVWEAFLRLLKDTFTSVQRLDYDSLFDNENDIPQAVVLYEVWDDKTEVKEE
eukprot:Clim_evm46s191 gene=Clim_evmTU46s191